MTLFPSIANGTVQAIPGDAAQLPMTTLSKAKRKVTKMIGLLSALNTNFHVSRNSTASCVILCSHSIQIMIKRLSESAKACWSLFTRVRLMILASQQMVMKSAASGKSLTPKLSQFLKTIFPKAGKLVRMTDTSSIPRVHSAMERNSLILWQLLRSRSLIRWVIASKPSQIIKKMVSPRTGVILALRPYLLVQSLLLHLLQCFWLSESLLFQIVSIYIKIL